MDYKFVNNHKTIRMKTPSTNYSIYSSPPISPINFYSPDQSPKNTFAQSLKFKIAFESLKQRYFLLNTYKERVNASCLKLLKFSRNIEIRKASLNLPNNKIGLLSQIVELREEQEDVTGIEEKVFKLEQQNKEEKEALEITIQDYHQKLEQVSELNKILKVILDRSKKLENYQETLKSFSIQKSRFSEILKRNQKEIREVSIKKERIYIQISAKSSKKVELENTISKLKNKQKAIKDSENVIGYLDAKSHFTTADLSIMHSHYQNKLSIISSKKAEISQRKLDILKKNSELLELKSRINKKAQSLEGMKKHLHNQEISVLENTSCILFKEQYLDKLETNLHEKFEILQLLYKTNDAE